MMNPTPDAFWVEGQSNRVKARLMERDTELDVLRKRLDDAVSPSDRGAIRAEIRAARERCERDIARMENYLF